MDMGLKRGDHLCAFYEGSEEKDPFISRFTIEGLKQKERVVIISGGDSQKSLPPTLSREGFDVPSLMRDKELVFQTPQETFHRIEPLRSWDIIEMLGQFSLDAVRDGFSGLRLGGESSWLLEEKVDIEKWLDYEREAGSGLSRKAMTMLCLYDLNRFPEWVIRELLEYHSHAAIGSSGASQDLGAPALILDRGMGIIHRNAGLSDLLGRVCEVGESFADDLTADSRVRLGALFDHLDSREGGSRARFFSQLSPSGGGELEVDWDLAFEKRTGLAFLSAAKVVCTQPSPRSPWRTLEGPVMAAGALVGAPGGGS
jgi:hypothetical protein